MMNFYDEKEAARIACTETMIECMSQAIELADDVCNAPCTPRTGKYREARAAFDAALTAAEESDYLLLPLVLTIQEVIPAIDEYNAARDKRFPGPDRLDAASPILG